MIHVTYEDWRKIFEKVRVLERKVEELEKIAHPPVKNVPDAYEVDAHFVKIYKRLSAIELLNAKFK